MSGEPVKKKRRHEFTSEEAKAARKKVDNAKLRKVVWMAKVTDGLKKRGVVR